MKCCECQKQADTEKNAIPPEWYGRYQGPELVAVICSDCIKEPEKLERWRKD